MVAVKTGLTPPPMPGMPAPMQPMMPMGGPGTFPAPQGGNPFAPLPPMPLAGSPPPMGGPGTFPVAPNRQFAPQQGSNAPRRKRFGDSLETMLGRNQGIGSVPQQRPLPMPQQQRMVAPGTPMMRTPPMGRGMPRPMQMGGEVDIFGYEDGGSVVQHYNPGGEVSAMDLRDELLGATSGDSGVVSGSDEISSVQPSNLQSTTNEVSDRVYFENLSPLKQQIMQKMIEDAEKNLGQTIGETAEYYDQGDVDRKTRRQARYESMLAGDQAISDSMLTGINVRAREALKDDFRDLFRDPSYESIYNSPDFESSGLLRAIGFNNSNDPRDWEKIMASSDPIAAARLATRQAIEAGAFSTNPKPSYVTGSGYMNPANIQGQVGPVTLYKDSKGRSKFFITDPSNPDRMTRFTELGPTPEVAMQRLQRFGYGLNQDQIDQLRELAYANYGPDSANPLGSGDGIFQVVDNITPFGQYDPEMLSQNFLTTGIDPNVYKNVTWMSPTQYKAARGQEAYERMLKEKGLPLTQPSSDIPTSAQASSGIVRALPSSSDFDQQVSYYQNPLFSGSEIDAINFSSAPSEVDVFDYLSSPTYGSLLSNEVEEMANGGTVPRQTLIAGQPHGLAYINQDEEALLRSFGGSGIAGPGGIPSYPPKGVTSGGGASDAPKTFDSGYKPITTNYKDDDDDDDDKPSSYSAFDDDYEDYTPTSDQLNQQLSDAGQTNITSDTSNVNFGATSSGQDFTTAAQADTDVSGAEFVSLGGLGAVSSGAPDVTLGSTETLPAPVIDTPVIYTDIMGNTHSSAADRDRANLGYQQASYQAGKEPFRRFGANYYDAVKPPEGKEMAGDRDRIMARAGEIFPTYLEQINKLYGEVGQPEKPFTYEGIGAIGLGDNRDDTQANLGAGTDPSFPKPQRDPYTLDDLLNLEVGMNNAAEGFRDAALQDLGIQQGEFPGNRGFTPSGTQIAPEAATVTPTENFESTAAMLKSNIFDPSGGATETDPYQFPVEKIQSMFSPKAGTGGSDRDDKSRPRLTSEELEKLKASLGEQVPISGVEKVINQVIGKAFFGLGSSFADKLRNSSEAERRAIVDQHLNALNSGATPVYNDKGEYVGFNIDTMDTFADKVLAAEDISKFLPGGAEDADGDGVPDYERFQQVFDAQSTAADADPLGQSTEQGFITSDGKEFFVDAGGNVVEVKDGVVPFEIGGGDDTIDIFDTTTFPTDNDNTSGPDTGFKTDEDGNIICNTEGYVHNPETNMCEPPKEEDEDEKGSDNITPTINIVRGEDFDDVLRRVVTAAPSIAPISANVQTMQKGGMAGLNRAADNFLKALAG